MAIASRAGVTAFEPAYLRLHQSGELAVRVGRALKAIENCELCPRECRVDRMTGKSGVCRTGRHATVASYAPHFGEEDCLRGHYGSGAIFFAGCNMRCVFCQNFEISWQVEGRTAPPDELAGMMIELQHQGCHNINLVTPEHVVPQIIEALPKAIELGLRVPLVYNTGGYDSMASLKLLDGIVDIYMPDFKYWNSPMARLYSKASDYPTVARRAIREMHRQVGNLVLDKNGLAQRGLLLRHLVMPGNIAGTRAVMKWIAREISPATYVNVMDQYYPAGEVSRTEYPEINRRIRPAELEQALEEARAAGLRRVDFRRPTIQSSPLI